MRKKIKKKKISMFIPLTGAAGVMALAVIFFAIYKLPFKISSVSENQNLTVRAGALCTLPISNTTFIKSYRLLVFTKINGAWPTKDGGYIVSGTTDPNIIFIPPDGFVAKLDKQGSIQWLKFLKTTNAAGVGNRLGDEDVQSIIELKDGGYLMASKVWGFIKAAEWNADNIELNKILFTKLDSKGNLVWDKSFTAKVEDAKNSLLETDDGGFLFHAGPTDLTPDKLGEDSDVYYDLPYSSLKVFKFDKNGDIQWSKNLKNFISRQNDSYLVQTTDGGYALAGNIGEANSEKEPPYDFDTYPGLAKFDKDFNFEWAKSLEGVPLEIPAAILQPDGTYKIGHKEMRQGASNVHGLVQTKDNGYLVLGNLAAALSLITDSSDLSSGLPHSYLIGFKFDSSGKIEWVKKMTLSFNKFTSPMTDFSISLTSNDDILMAGPTTWADEDYEAKIQKVNDLEKWYTDKYGAMEMLKDLKARSKQSRADWAIVQSAIDAADASFREAVLTMKTDQELNVSWTKIIKPQRSITNYVLKPTADQGAIIAGEYETKVIQSVIAESKTYYKDGFLIKFDASGNVKNDTSWITNYNGKVAMELLTSYATSNDLIVQAEPYELGLTDRKPEFSLYKKSKTATYASFKSLNYTLCPVAPEISETPQNSPNNLTEQKTWPEINYEKAVSVEPINDKSKTINDEMLPILNQLYNNQVKLTDNMGGAMLDYIFSRVVTSDDKTAVKNYLAGLGYKMEDETVYQLTMYKVGYFLTLTFSIDNTNKGFLEITY
jgi:hypothetical protein